MKYLKVKILVILLISSAFTLSLSAQKSESEVKIEEKLIEASRERILGNYDKSLEILREAKKLNRDDDAIAYELGVIYDLNEDPESAIKMFNDAIRLDPTNKWYYKHLAALYQETGNFEKGVEIYEALIAMEPLDSQNYYRKAYFLVLDNKIDEALSFFDEIEEKFGFNEKIARRKHSLFLGKGNFKKAANEFIKLIDQNPKNMEYRLALAQFYEAHGQKKQATKVYQDIIKFDPANSKAKIALTGDYQPQKAGETNYLNSLKEVFSQKNIDIDLKISKLYPIIEEVSKTNDLTLATKALELSTILETVHPEEAKAFAVSGDFLYFSNQLEPALEKYKKTLQLNKNNFIVWENVMNIEWELKQIKALQKTAEEALDLFPNKAIVYYMYALAANESGAPSDALNMLRQAEMMTGKDLPMRFKIFVLEGDLYCQLEKKDRAAKAYDKASAINATMKVARKCN